MIIRRNMDHVKNFMMDAFDNVEIHLTHDEMMDVYKVVNRYLKRQTAYAYLWELKEDEHLDISDDECDEIAGRMADGMLFLLEEDDDIVSAEERFMFRQAKEILEEEYGIDLCDGCDECKKGEK